MLFDREFGGSSVSLRRSARQLHLVDHQIKPLTPNRSGVAEVERNSLDDPGVSDLKVRERNPISPHRILRGIYYLSGLGDGYILRQYGKG
jgi:hypothetical protein